MNKSVRSIFGSDLVIVWALLAHLFEGTILLTIYPVPRSVPMASLLAVFHHQVLAGVVMWIAAGLAAVGHWAPHKEEMYRFLLLLPQASLLFITGLGAIYLVIHGSYADGVPRPSITFMLPDQISRVSMPILYVAAMFARVRHGS